MRYQFGEDEKALLEEVLGIEAQDLEVTIGFVRNIEAERRAWPPAAMTSLSFKDAREVHPARSNASPASLNHSSSLSDRIV